MKSFQGLVIFFFAIAFHSFFSTLDAKSLQYGSEWTYQPIVVNGKEITTSTSKTSGASHIIYARYEAIKDMLKKYNRPFTVLDLGANNGFFSLKIAEDFDATCVMVDTTDRLADICEANTERRKLIYLRKRFTKEDIKNLASCEHFDVVLALNVLHHVDDWRAWVDAFSHLADNVIIETPAANDPKVHRKHVVIDIAQFLLSNPSAVQIGSFLRGYEMQAYDHLIWICNQPSGFDKGDQKLGISPSTFFYFNGKFPRYSYVQKIQRQSKNRKWILQGRDYFYID